MNKSKIYLGGFLILIGCLFILQNMGLNINLGFYWPIFLLIPGVIFWISFYQDRENKSSAILIPGTILIVYSLYFFFNQTNDYQYAGETSFIFTLGIALGFFAAYYLAREKNRTKGFLIPAWILSGVALINLLGTTTQWEWWPILLIGIGVYLLYKKEPKSTETFDKNKGINESNN
ncbi:MAG: hypothetical protein Q8P20_02405 [bacterium]|nr:hypothetical protein [bacterium]